MSLRIRGSAGLLPFEFDCLACSNKWLNQESRFGGIKFQIPQVIEPALFMARPPLRMRHSTILGLYWDNGKENGNDYNGLYWGLRTEIISNGGPEQFSENFTLWHPSH